LTSPIGRQYRRDYTALHCWFVVAKALGERLPESIFKTLSCGQQTWGFLLDGIVDSGVTSIRTRIAL
jgi:hypothetical protein